MLKKLYFLQDGEAPYTVISSQYVLNDILQDRLIEKVFTVQHNLASLFCRPYTD